MSLFVDSLDVDALIVAWTDWLLVLILFGLGLLSVSDPVAQSSDCLCGNLKSSIETENYTENNTHIYMYI